MKLAARMLSVCLVASLCSGTACAGLFRAYLSFTGNDANPCTVVAPCRLLPAALAAINDGGEIWMLDSANYNVAPVNITKSAKILAIPGEMGSIVGNGGDAIIINAPLGSVTLRNLVVLNFAGGVNGITIQDASAVHIEKVSIDGFNTDASSCIQLLAATTVRLYVDDSFLRGCRNGIYALGPVALASNSSVVVDNTRIERGVNTGGTGVTIGVWMLGQMDVSLRNSVISRQSAAIQFDNLLANQVSRLDVINSEITRNSVALQFTNTAAGARGQISIVGSQIVQNTDAIIASSTATGTLDTRFRIVDSHIADLGNGGIQLSNSAADVNARMSLDLIRSELINVSTTAIDLAATNGGRVRADVRDSTIANVTTGVKTSGSSSIVVTLVRSGLHRCTTAIDHGFGTVRLDGSNVHACDNDFVNNGSGSIVSLGNNFVNDNTNGTGGMTYITPAIIAPK